MKLWIIFLVRSCTVIAQSHYKDMMRWWETYIGQKGKVCHWWTHKLLPCNDGEYFHENIVDVAIPGDTRVIDKVSKKKNSNTQQIEIQKTCLVLIHLIVLGTLGLIPLYLEKHLKNFRFCITVPTATFNEVSFASVIADWYETTIVIEFCQTKDHCKEG